MDCNKSIKCTFRRKQTLPSRVQMGKRVYFHLYGQWKNRFTYFLRCFDGLGLYAQDTLSKRELDSRLNVFHKWSRSTMGTSFQESSEAPKELFKVSATPWTVKARNTFSDSFVDFFSYKEICINKLNFSCFNTWRKAVQMLTYFYFIVPLAIWSLTIFYFSSQLLPCIFKNE